MVLIAVMSKKASGSPPAASVSKGQICAPCLCCEVETPCLIAEVSLNKKTAVIAAARAHCVALHTDPYCILNFRARLGIVVGATVQTHRLS